MDTVGVIGLIMLFVRISLEDTLGVIGLKISVAVIGYLIVVIVME